MAGAISAAWRMHCVVNPMEIASAWTVFANGGFKVSPYIVQRIESRDGKTLFTANPPRTPERLQLVEEQNASLLLEEPNAEVVKPVAAEQIIDERTAYIMTSMLQDVIKRGTGRRALALGRTDLAGKTVAVTRGTLEDTSITKEAPATTTVKRFDEPNGAISAFVSGQVPLLVVGNDVGATIMAKNPKLSMEQKYQLFSSPSHVALNKNEPALKAKVDAILTKAKTDGSLNTISVKWLKAPLPKDLKD